ncbi:MAG: hypothetical protein HEP71_26875 [Roseivirga sp.]|nr:hypothetical protein [Roseivirga sp.]
MRVLTIFVFLFIALSAAGQAPQKSLRQLLNESTTAYEKKDFKAYLELLREFDERRPNYPDVVYKLAGAYSLNKRKTRSIQTLQKVLLMDATFDFENDRDFKNIRKYKGYDRLVALKDRLGKKEVHDEVFLTVDVGLIHPESMVLLDNGTILLGSVREKKIVRIDPQGEVSDWLDTDLSVLGMEVHYGTLWVSTAAMPEMEGYEPNMRGRSIILQVSLTNGAILQGIEFDDESLIGDIELDKESRIWLSNSMIPYLSRDVTDSTIYAGAFIRKQYDLGMSHFNLQGLTLNKDETALYFADYVSGIHKLNVKTDDITPVLAPTTSLLKGIDGLYHYNTSLIAIHNGVKPYRIMQYFLDETGDNILMERVINRGGESLGEPTNGLVKDGYFYYIANSPWGAYDDDREIDSTKVKPLEIRRIKLD